MRTKGIREKWPRCQLQRNLKDRELRSTIHQIWIINRHRIFFHFYWILEKILKLLVCTRMNFENKSKVPSFPSNFFKVYLFILRTTESEQVGGGAETELQARSALPAQSDVGLKLMNHEIMS